MQLNILLASQIAPATPSTLAHRIILHETDTDYVTHYQNMGDGSIHWGNYYRKCGDNPRLLAMAVKNFAERCLERNLIPDFTPKDSKVILTYKVTERYGIKDMTLTNEGARSIWYQLTGRKTLDSARMELMRDLTGGRIQFEEVK